MGGYEDKQNKRTKKTESMERTKQRKKDRKQSKEQDNEKKGERTRKKKGKSFFDRTFNDRLRFRDRSTKSVAPTLKAIANPSQRLVPIDS